VTHPIDHPKLRLQRVNNPPPTPHVKQIIGALGPCQSVELRLQPLTDLGFLMIQQRQEVLGLPDLSNPVDGKGDNLRLATHPHTIRPIHHSCPGN
jgi:hypothetical protein